MPCAHACANCQIAPPREGGGGGVFVSLDLYNSAWCSPLSLPEMLLMVVASTFGSLLGSPWYVNGCLWLPYILVPYLPPSLLPSLLLPSLSVVNQLWL